MSAAKVPLELFTGHNIHPTAAPEAKVFWLHPTHAADPAKLLKVPPAQATHSLPPVAFTLYQARHSQLAREVPLDTPCTCECAGHSTQSRADTEASWRV